MAAVIGWRVVTDQSDGVEAFTSALRSQEHAVGYACDLLAAGISVARIEGPGVEIGAEKVVVLWAGHRRAPERVWPGSACTAFGSKFTTSILRSGSAYRRCRHSRSCR